MHHAERTVSVGQRDVTRSRPCPSVRQLARNVTIRATFAPRCQVIEQHKRLGKLLGRAPEVGERLDYDHAERLVDFDMVHQCWEIVRKDDRPGLFDAGHGQKRPELVKMKHFRPVAPRTFKPGARRRSLVAPAHEQHIGRRQQRRFAVRPGGASGDACRQVEGQLRFPRAGGPFDESHLAERNHARPEPVDFALGGDLFEPRQIEPFAGGRGDSEDRRFFGVVDLAAVEFKVIDMVDIEEPYGELDELTEERDMMKPLS